MATHLQKPGSDVNVWGVAHNDYHKVLLGEGEYIEVLANANNPPTIKQYTRFQLYATDASYTIPASPSTENNTYPANSTPTYLMSQAIYEDGADVTFTWSGTVRGEVLPAQSDGTWYLVCKNQLDTDATTKGQGVYTVSKTETPTWSYQKGGYYSASGYRVLAEFTSTAGVVAITRIFQDRIHRYFGGNIIIKNNTLDSDINIQANFGGTIQNFIVCDASEGYVRLLDGIQLTLGTGNDGRIYVSSDDLIIGNATSNKDIIFQVNDGGVTTEVMRIDGSASTIGIGGTIPTNSKLQVTGNSAVTSCIKSYDSSGDTNWVRLFSDGAAGNTRPCLNWDAGSYMRFAESNDDFTSFTERMRIETDGGLYVFSLLQQSAAGLVVEYDTSSKEIYAETCGAIFKENIRDIDGNESDFLHQLTVKKFDSKVGKQEKDRIDFIADDMVGIADKYVVYGKDSDEDGNPIEGTDYVAGYNKMGLIPLLVLEIQKLNARIEALEGK
jgi:hypothetical protein